MGLDTSRPSPPGASVAWRWTRAALTIVLASVGLAVGQSPERAQAYYLYYCPGYVANNEPPNCNANPYASPGMHSWLVRQAPKILEGDGYQKASNLLRAPLDGSTYVEWINAGTIAADTGLNGCTDYGRSAGWELGDHMLNPYRDFGVWSYSGAPLLGYVGYGYVRDQARRVGPCAGSPRVRSNAARMADEFFARATKAWGEGRRKDAMFNLGISLHVIMDAAVPSHAHPEVNVGWLQVTNPSGGRERGRDAFPAWANEMMKSNPGAIAVSSGGLYEPPASSRGVQIARTPGGWAYWMASESYPYFPWSGSWSAIGRDAVRCDVTNFPEVCPNAATAIVQRSERASAGFIRFFLAKVGDGAASK